MPRLPIHALLPELTETLERHSCVILQAPPGAGKTTAVPPALLDARWRGDGRILMLEPRRLAARAAARFMAAELGEQPGQTVGYRTRLDSRVSPQTRIEVVTEGILTRLIQSDPALEAYSAVLFDEFHERSLQGDLGLALVRESQQALRDDLRLLLMSATLDSGPLSRLLDGAPVLSSEGRAYPVATRYLGSPGRGELIPALCRAIRRALAEDDGSLLVFLPGAGEIRRLADALTDQLPEEVQLAPLFGQLNPEEQDRAIDPAPPGQRKLVLATAIAETSLTIEGIRVVIDAGLERKPRFDPNSGMTRLDTRRVSRASADQRRGRAGRTAPGVCYRLWSESEQAGLAAFSTPEILEADLAPVVLELARWGSRDPDTLSWLDTPPRAHWQQAVALLQDLGALDGEALITRHGQTMLERGAHPRLAHMLIRGRGLGLEGLAARLAALLEERDLLGREAGADMGLRLRLLEDRDRPPRGLGRRLKTLRQTARKHAPNATTAQTSDEAVGRLLALAFPDRIARRRGPNSARYQLSNGRGAFLDEGDPLSREEWLATAALDGQAREARIFLAAPISLAALESLLPAQFETRDCVDWDEERGRVIARRRRYFGRIPVADQILPDPSPAQMEAGLLAMIKQRGLAILPWKEAARQLQARLALLHAHWPAQWPDVSDENLLATLDDWLAPFLAGLRRRQDLSRLDLLTMLQSRLDHAQQKALARLAPATLTVPSGQSVRLDYTAEQGPVLAVKLQALFGLEQTPRVANGRVPVSLHLLSPAGRPVAITADLASFWQQGYPQVRKDMRGRYPKHPWPEDPLSAAASMRTKPRG